MTPIPPITKNAKFPLGVFIEVAKNPTLRVTLIFRSESLHPCVYLASDQESVGALVCKRNVNEAAPVPASLNVIG